GWKRRPDNHVRPGNGVGRAGTTLGDAAAVTVGGIAVPYNQTGYVVHDADAHIMETPNWLRDHADPGIRDRIAPLRYPGGNELRQTGDPAEQQRDLDAAFARLAAKHASDA